MIDAVGVCAHILRLSTRHGVEPLAVVGLLAVHSLVETNFAQLRVWQKVAAEMHQTLTA
ncbi:MAG: hypothetical protein LCH56_10685 [Proteobacteria bacterium]|nr:hypothetical protein [Pseudomonadota bacterium]